MKFFTPVQKTRLIVGGVAGAIATGIFTLVGRSIGGEVGHTEADSYAKQAGCEHQWDDFHYVYQQRENITAVCGELCEKVCEAASLMIMPIADNYTIGFAVTTAIVTLAGVGGYALWCYKQNQTDPEFQRIEDSAVNYSSAL